LFQTNLGFAIVGGTTIILGAFYMLRMFQQAMLGETNAKPFADVSFNEGIVFVLIIGFLLFFGLYPKPIIDLITPSIQDILVHIK
jgi:NADH-quinone oxidoreductase subunit M